MIRVFEPELTLKDKLSVLKTLRKNYISGTSPVVNEFEVKAAKSFDRKYALAVSNGSVALDLAFQLFDFNRISDQFFPNAHSIHWLSSFG